MQIDLQYDSLSHSDLAPGTFFWLLRHQPVLCMKVTASDAPGNVIFERNEAKGGLPWVSVDDFPDNETVITLRHGVLRPDAETVTANGYAAPPLGAIISHNGINLVAAGAGMGRRLHFDLANGNTYPAFRDGQGVHYSSWSIGAIRDQIFWEAYSFPINTSG